jgi:hypothetical protein
LILDDAMKDRIDEMSSIMSVHSNHTDAVVGLILDDAMKETRANI